MRTVLTTHELFHAWADQAQPYARAGNVRFDGPTLYSYAEPIGFMLSDGRVMISNRAFSVTTRRHQSRALGATSHLTHIDAHALPTGERWLNEAHQKNSDHFQFNLQMAFNTLAAYPRRKKSVNASVYGTLRTRDAYSTFFNLAWAPLSFEGSQDECEAAAKAYAVAEEQRRKVALEQAAAQIIEQAEALQRWREGGPLNRAFQVTALRVKDDVIQTSRGAEIPVEHAIKAWPLLKRIRNSGAVYQRGEHSLHFGRYTLEKFDGETLTVGCHQIIWGEIETISHRLGLT